MKASHAGNRMIFNGQEITVHSGEFVTGRNALTIEMNRGAKPAQLVHSDFVWRSLKKLENAEMLHIKSNNRYSVISVVHWDEYQQSAQPADNQPTSNRQPTDTINNAENANNAQEGTTTTDRQKVFNFFEQGGFGQLGGFQIQNIDEEIKDFTTAGSPEPEHMVVLGLQEALNNNVRKWSYARAVMHSWQDNKVLSAKDVEAYKASHRPQDGAFSQPQGDESDDLPF
ncbi:DnaD domain protein [Furfurilactobacillus milii]|uniref:DnaD domain protein n=1 Tax=Furfurilactobacillus milii TaxID=2888272 RepID=UPI001EEF045C|nr:DnaD domain protein [Furfurilactobacillus milii]MCF6419795.1 DnaD domain protein [Furfurilactobacillus milii]